MLRGGVGSGYFMEKRIPRGHVAKNVHDANYQLGLAGFKTNQTDIEDMAKKGMSSSEIFNTVSEKAYKGSLRSKEEIDKEIKSATVMLNRGGFNISKREIEDMVKKSGFNAYEVFNKVSDDAFRKIMSR